MKHRDSKAQRERNKRPGVEEAALHAITVSRSGSAKEGAAAASMSACPAKEEFTLA
jgi:hypothetical protein